MIRIDEGRSEGSTDAVEALRERMAWASSVPILHC